jgi:succinoglycan biosynthesis protein ExoO
MSEWVVVATERNVWPPQHGCDARIARMLRGWRACGLKTCLVGSSGTTVGQAADLVDDLVLVGGGPSWDSFMDLDLFDFWPYLNPVAKACERHKASAVVAEYIWMVAALRDVGHGVVRVVDTHDLMHRRKAIYEDHGINPWIKVSRDDEADILSKADVVVAIQDEEAEVFREMVPGRRVVVSGHWADVRRLPCDEKSNGVMFVGSNNPSNEHCLRWFIEGIWPKVLAEVPDARLMLYGRIAEMADFGAFKGVVPVGFVPNLDAAYSSAKVVVNPVILGTGLKIKTVEALGKGKAVVCTSEGCAGMPVEDGKAFSTRNGEDAFASKVATLLKDERQRKDQEEAAFEYAKRHLSVDAVMGDLVRTVMGMAAERASKSKAVIDRPHHVVHGTGDMFLRRAVECWRSAACRGNVQCMRNMAWAYTHGVGLKADAASSAEWESMASGKAFRSDPRIGQDKWVVSMLDGKRGGYFVEAGASDGLGGSNTYVLEKAFGWKGVCVEANREFFKALRRNRSCGCEHVCLSDRDGLEKFREAGYFGGIDRELKEEHRKDWEGGEVVEVRAECLGLLLKRVGAPRTIDYMSIDLEGGEVAVLDGFPWEEWDVRLMTVEKSCQEVEDVVRAAGFDIVKNEFSASDVGWELHCVKRD